MNIFPAIDLYEGQAVRLVRGDYADMTVYSREPVSLAKSFERMGAKYLHVVDLEGAKTGRTPNLNLISDIAAQTNLFVEAGGGMRSMEAVRACLSGGASRVILGTAALTDEAFLRRALDEYGEKIAVGVDLKDGRVAIRGWTETSDETGEAFCAKMQALGVKTMICTDISRDGVMKGANRALYRALSEKFSMNIIASGGVSTLDDVRALAGMKLYGAIIGKAYYTGAIDIARAIEVAK